jgi:hypothetical protein
MSTVAVHKSLSLQRTYMDHVHPSFHGPQWRNSSQLYSLVANREQSNGISNKRFINCLLMM